MKKAAVQLSALALGVIVGPWLAGTPPTRPLGMTCAQFASLPASVRSRAVAWMDGHTRAGREPLAAAEVDVERRAASLMALCTATPERNCWDVIGRALPAGLRRVRPATMTCREFLALDQAARLEVAYWMDGFAAAPDDAAVDLGRSLDVVVRDCRRAPDSPLREEMSRSF